jgi:signal transduction histidine kinase
VSTKPGIRVRLATVVLLGVLASTISLITLMNVLRSSTSQRVERVHDAVTETISKLAAHPDDVVDPVPDSIVGMRGGMVRSADAVATAAALPGRSASSAAVMPDSWRADFADLVTRLEASDAASRVETFPLGESRLIIGARRVAEPGTVAWAAYLVRPNENIHFMQQVLVGLAVVTALLVLSALHLAGIMVRGTRSINRSLRELGSDLDAPIPRPEVRELSNVADGIAQLAERLQRARREEARLGRELARQDRLTALGRVVAGVAHEVRNPLASIKLRLDLAVVDSARAARNADGAGANRLPPAAEQAIAHASSEIARLDRLVADLLVVAGGASGPKTCASLGELARARSEALSPWARERSIEIVVEGDAQAELEQDAVARAIDNLFRNAVEASPRGARVVVRVRGSGGGHMGTVGHAEIDVEDVGTGVPAGRVSELFEPFFTTKADGSGLGLALSRSIAQSHGGDLVYLRAGERTHFVLTLGGPIPQAAPGAQPTSASASHDVHEAAQ